ncbi:CDP-diacylglycerol--glycerol-3-phosphate 3-phosphatidyltransferase [Desulfosarcina widdelii]|uniref:CDP-diacylglycerol--glycerol-3-phosphate 3-phosphatidyltransferase n=1 Tax=Desulfosarcina widdelii TaxID=947919 RepID=A0A5K7YTU4_9BACT|nr:CDP-diacylglycerol--glycerol-3-phosphate 3-phosphatidyltransferase [Desulfosarcina widdelii]BBO72766.1 CDP-diacylglycerol--glycerol-3-phosphate 3-phosphatidyltransferase [Desulfosarcina widdelii]
MKKTSINSLLTHPNTLTLFRIVAVPVIVVLLLMPNRFTAFIAGLIFSAAAITDYFDGYLARRYGLVSNLGKVMDPVADKLLVSCSLIMLTALGWMPAWIACIIIGRELAVTGLRNIIAQNEMDVSASSLGKYKTGFQIAAIIPLMFHYPALGFDFQAIGMFFLWGALIFTLWSGTDYFLRFRKLLRG